MRAEQVVRPLQFRSSWSSRAQASTSSSNAGEFLASNVITFRRQARFT